MKINNPSSPISKNVAALQVYNADPGGSAFRDLNLSATIGARVALVNLRFYNPAGSATNFQLRTNGQTNNTYLYLPAAGSNAYGNLWQLTDALGIVEWLWATTTGVVEIYLHDYIY